MKTTLLKTTFLLIVALFINCTDDDNLSQDQLPPITQNGANTFGAIVDGRIFVAKDKTGYYPPGGRRPKGIAVTVGSSLPEYEFFGVDASNYEGIYIYIYIPKEIPENITYDFKSSPGVRSSLQKPNYAHAFAIINNEIYTTYENSGKIIFKKVDFNDGIYAGVFEMNLKNEKNQTIVISDGRFDL